MNSKYIIVIAFLVYIHSVNSINAQLKIDSGKVQYLVLVIDNPSSFEHAVSVCMMVNKSLYSCELNDTYNSIFDWKIYFRIYGVDSQYINNLDRITDSIGVNDSWTHFELNYGTALKKINTGDSAIDSNCSFQCYEFDAKYVLIPAYLKNEMYSYFSIIGNVKEQSIVVLSINLSSVRVTQFDQVIIDRIIATRNILYKWIKH